MAKTDPKGVIWRNSKESQVLVWILNSVKYICVVN